VIRSLRAIRRALGGCAIAFCAVIAFGPSCPAWGQSSPLSEYEVYQLQHKSAAEMQRVLGELLGEQMPQSDLIADPNSNRLLVRGSAETQRVARQLIDSLDRPPADQSKATPSAGGGKFIAMSEVRAERVESSLCELLGPRLRARESREPGVSHYWFLGASGPVGEILVDRQRNGLVLFLPDPLTRQLTELARALDVSASKQGRNVRILPIKNADPSKVREAYEAYRSGYREPSASDSSPAAKSPAKAAPAERKAAPSTQDQGRLFPHGGIEQVAYLFQAGGGGEGGGAAPGGMAADAGSPAGGGQEVIRDVGVDVEIETLPDLDVIIVRGRERDVEEVARMIEEIERLSALAEPKIEIYTLQHVGGEQLSDLIRQVQQELVGSRQGRVSITPLVKPNALLLIGWGEAIRAVKEMIARLDRPVDAATQSRIFRLEHAAAAQVATTIQQFFQSRPGLGPEVLATADLRTNSILVQASPRDMQEVELLIRRLDTDRSKAVTSARIFKVNNALATDLATTLQGAIDAARGRNAGAKSAALELLTIDAEGQRLLRSGILNDVEVMPDPHTNTLIVSGPAESMELIAALVEELDTPAAVAQIKVFRILNSDAAALALMLRTLLPAPTTSGLSPQLAGAENETSLVPVRFAVEPRTNTIIATGAPGDLAIIEALLLRLDAEEPEQRINKVYKLKNSPALDVATAINDFLRYERQVQQAAPGTVSPFQQIESEVVVVPEPVSNSLIISATPRFSEEIQRLVEELDAEPSQVVIQVLIAEVALGNTDEFGVELGLQDSLLFDRSVVTDSLLVPGFNFNNLSLGNSSSAESRATAGNVAGQALTSFSLSRNNGDLGYGGLVLSASNESVSVLIRALKESRRLDVLSRPQVMTLDNQPAYIQVGKRVPRITATTINSWGQSNSIVLENVGLIMGVTPRISPDGMVVMEIDAEKSELDPTQGIPVSFSGDRTITSPVINLATAQTTVSAADGQTVVLGGMITKNTSTTKRRIPYLSNVPVLGQLFRYDLDTETRTELLIILTPHVVRNFEDADRIKQIEAARIDWCLADIHRVHGPVGLRGEAVVYPDSNPRGLIPGPDSPEPLDAPVPLDQIPLPEPFPNGEQSAWPPRSADLSNQAQVGPRPASATPAAFPVTPAVPIPPIGSESSPGGVRVRIHPLPGEAAPGTLETSGAPSVQPAAYYAGDRAACPPYADYDPRFRQQNW
jgi:type II secretion system protein D